MKLDAKTISSILIIFAIKKSNFSLLIDNINENIYFQNPNFSEILFNSNIFTFACIYACTYIPSISS